MNYTSQNFAQGSDAWHQHRATHLNASDAAAMLGLSSYKTRAELLRECATGLRPEPDEATQRRFADGHAFEKAARPLVEAKIGDQLFPDTVSRNVDGLPLSASLDGITMDGELHWEHKTSNDTLRASLERGEIPSEYEPQMEQGLLITGATECLFSISRGTPETLLTVNYKSKPILRAMLIAGWKQFQIDLAAYVPEPVKVEAVGRAPDALPALFVQLAGGVQATNLPEFKAAAIAVFQAIRTDLATDQDFADAEKAVKFCGEVESKLKAAKDAALGQTASIDELFRTIDAISAEARTKRLELEKLVKARKEEIRTDIVTSAQSEIGAHILRLNSTLSVPILPPDTRTSLLEAIKGKKTVASLKDACAQVVANAKITASAEAERHRTNIAVLEAAGRLELFPDRDALVRVKQPDDLKNLAATRIAEADKREHDRLEAERQRIREEEQRKAQAEVIKSENPMPPKAAVSASATAEATPVAQAGVAPAPAGLRIKLGDINARIAPLSISAEGLASLGFHPVAIERAAKLYDGSAMPRICQLLAQRLMAVAAAPLQEAA